MASIKEGCIFLVDKPYKWTSFDVIRKMQYTFNNQVKIGHGGTLDPLATGLLIVCTGRCTKLMDEFLNDNKKYSGTITLGSTTPSYDLETEINNTFDFGSINDKQIIDNATTFLGEIEQIPPVHSAIKQGGKPVYLKARKNIEIVMKPRQVKIFDFTVSNIMLPNFDFEITCSKGTYIRSIANDFGAKLNNGSHLSALRRLESGGFNINQTWQLPNLLDLLKVKMNELQPNADTQV
jgi:tRNA pseudouridine55 synthase